MSHGEVAVWTELRRRKVGVRFHRQHPIGPYIVDFACLRLNLIIEIDGSITTRYWPTRSAINT